MAELRPLHPLKGNQRAASDPREHVWLSASAGTGKTQVLAARVWRLLLNGTDPSAILCLTFTKAGAAEMSERITSKLAHWVRASEKELVADLEALGESISPEGRETARQLFAKVLDAPGGGIRIQTIHSFCQSLLSAFPVEAGLVPGFRPLDAREEAVLAREALAEMLVDAQREGRSALIDAIGALSMRLGEGQAEAFLGQCAAHQEALEALPSGIQPYLRRAMGLPTGDVDAEIEKCCADDAFDCAGLREIAAMNAAWGTKGGLTRADEIAMWLTLSPAKRAARLADLHLVWAKKDGEIRSFGKGQAPQDAGYADLATRLYGRCGELIAMKVQADYCDLLAAGLEAGRTYAETYARAKRRIGAVDFDDLIRRTIELLGEPGMGEWVRYKLDQTTEHVLIDEAQDTNPRQWAIVAAIADEFFAGQGLKGDKRRTLFTVGDYKQAIFGFQGTDPILFRAAFERFRALSDFAPDPQFDLEPRPINELSLTHSFRSTRPVLQFVDAAIEAMPAPGMGTGTEGHASEIRGPGTVTLWSPTIAGGEDDEEGWIDDAVRGHARRIARAIKSWLDQGLMLESKGRALRPEDIMILVKRRGELASLIVARLYAEGVPVAGVDRLRLNAPLAVQDLLAAIRFALQPGDDLSLAALLVSPLIGWSQDDLMAAAMRGKDVGLWRHLQESQPEDRLEPLRALLSRADFTTPYRFLEEILSGPLQGRRKLLLRLGEEARDPIEELLSAALDFEKLATPSLQRFLDWFDRGDVEIVRDAAQPQNAVRVMTAHGAKGLQAPMVILADACVDPTRSPRDFLLWAPEEGAEKIPIFRPRAAERSGALDAVVQGNEQRENEEHWRLFYVAATRAEERLVITGSLGPRAKGVPPEQSWYAASAAAFDAFGVEAGDERAFRGTRPEAPVAAKTGHSAAVADRRALPAWIAAPPPEEARPPRPLAPSSLGEDMVADPPPTAAMRAAAERGRLLHALFERLPTVAPERRADAAARWLEVAGGVADAALREELIAAALGVIEDSRFADLFGADSLPEAPIAAVIEGGQVIAGTVDRLSVTPDRVRVVDFKTGRRAPSTPGDIPPYHLRQMAAYAAALRVIFPGREVEAALLYTAGPVLHALDDDLLRAHKPGFAGAEQSLTSRA